MINLTLNIPSSAAPYIYRHRFNHRLAFAASVVADYHQLRRFLPTQAAVILDIGCGMAAIDVLLARHYPDAQLWLLDGDGDEPRNGWNAELNAFSSRAVADELLAANGVSGQRWIDVNTPEPLKADLVISIASWGYHYPISTYDVTGYCIADLRRVVEPPRGKLIADYPKRTRCAWHLKGTL